MTDQAHFRRLERMYDASPINGYFLPKLKVDEGYATIDMTVEPKFFHSANAVHGAVYFKLLDDAAWFAANSLETEVFMLTNAFTTYITRPINHGVMTAVGEVLHAGRTQIIAESVIFDEDEEEIARANGIFMRSTMKLSDTEGYGKETP
ncbi:MAG: PaaI family thioesterase [Agarilytica sp.]